MPLTAVESEVRRLSATSQRRRLVLDSIGSDFNPATHVVLGPWCFLGQESIVPDWDSLGFVDTLGAPEQRCAEADAVRGLVAALRDEIFPEMNKRHGVNYSREFWHLLLVDWLVHLVMVSWQLWKHIDAFVARVGSESLEVELTEACGKITFPDTLAFVEACYHQSEFRSVLVSDTVRRLAPPHWTLSAGKSVVPASGEAQNVTTRRHKRVGLVNGIGRRERLILTAAILAAPKKAAQFGPLFPASRAGFPGEYVTFVADVARTMLPDSIGKDFPALDAAARRKTYRRGRIHLLTINVHSDVENVELAHAVAAGERIVDVQHGGVYGTASIAPCAPDLEYCHDTFVSWGWTKHDRYAGRFLPLPSPLLSRFAARRHQSNGDIIFVGTQMAPFNPRIDYSSEPLEYRRWKRRFVRTLDCSLRAGLGYRPYFSPRSMEDASWLQRDFPKLRVLDGNLDEALLSCKLAVLDYPGTTLAQTLAANIPTICFWDNEQWLQSPLAEPLFARLRSAGILFHSPEEAARQLNAVAGDVEAWWNEPQRQEARAAWCHEYARVDRNWLWHWVKALWTL